ncbi:MAG: GDSL-type esterase/lipase family protein [Treponema sp.]|nr:GDSL-type esterase/lipase family protein [Treponema sp.]
MKKNILLLFLIVAIGFSFFTCKNDTINHDNDDQGISLVCLGDSLTAGYGASTPGEDDESKSFPAFLQAKVKIPVINAGVSGDTTAQGLSRVDKDVLAKDPGIIIILLGANDVFNLISPSTTKANLQSIIDKVDNGKRKIYLAKFYTEDVARQLFSNYGITNYDFQTTMINRNDEMFSSLASENNVTLIEDIWQGVWGEHMSDEVHPDAAGYKIMADNIFNVLKPYLQANGLLKNYRMLSSLYPGRIGFRFPLVS